MIGMNEMIIAIIAGAIIFLFGAGKVKEWIHAFKDVKSDYEEPKKSANM